MRKLLSNEENLSTVKILQNGFKLLGNLFFMCLAFTNRTNQKFLTCVP